MNNTKTALLTPDPPDNFQIKNIILRVSKQRNNKYKIEPIYKQGILYSRKENKQIAITTMTTKPTITNHQPSKNF